jgi:hypothetical protein
VKAIKAFFVAYSVKEGLIFLLLDKAGAYPLMILLNTLGKLLEFLENIRSA